MDNFLTDYIKAIENPNKVGWNGKVWTAPNLKGYDPNQRGYGIDIRYNDSAKALTKNRKGQWLTDSEATNLMNDRLNYLKGVALRKIKGFDNFSPKKQAIILGMLYRGDSVLSNVDVNEQDDTKFMNSVHNYYISKGLNERAKNSSNFFNKQQQKRNVSFTQPIIDYSLPLDNTRVEKPIIIGFKKGGLIRKMLTAAGGPIYQINPAAQEWGNNWKDRMTGSRVLREWTGKERPKRNWKKEELKRILRLITPQRTWRSDVADALHGIGEGVVALNPYTAVPYYGAKVGLDFLNGTYGWHTALNASVPLFHLSPQAVGLKEATNVALEDVANLGSKTARNWRVAREINLATKNKPNIEISNPTEYNISDNITLYRANPTNIKNLSYKGERYGDTSGLYVGKWFTDESSKPNWYASNMAKRGEDPAYYLVTVPRYWAKKQKASYKISNPNIEYEPEDYIIEDGINKLQGLLYQGRPGTIQYLLLSFLTPIMKGPSTSLKFFERKPAKISEAERAGVPKGERNLPFKEKQLTEHVQGDEAVKMFKEYGGEPIPEGSINGELLRKYVAEARERYGLINNKNITDEEIAQTLYKHSKELGGNTAAINSQGEPQLLFRGDTRRYTLLKERMSPEELAKKSGTMDNSLGNLFLGEFPDSWRGVDRYIGTWRNFNGTSKLVGSGTGSKVVWDGKMASEIEGFPYLGPLAGGGYKLYSQPYRYGNIDVYKLPASMMESGVNDLNAFIVRTPLMRNATSEISVLNDDWILHGAKDSHFMSKNYKYNPKTYSMENVKTGKSLGEITTESAPESRVAMGDHYKELLKEAKQKQEGLLKSEANSPLRDEHSLYSYFALPNFNIQGAKHLLPYDLRKTRNWKDKNIYRGLIPLTTGYTLYNLFNQPLLQLQYLKQGGKMNVIKWFEGGGRIRKMLTAAGGPLKAPLVRINGKWTKLQSQGDGNLSAEGRLFQVKTKPTNALGSGNDLVVTPRKKATIQTTPKPTQEYRSAFDSSAIPEFINAMTAGGFNNLSPTQWARRAYDAVDLMKGNMSQKQYINSWINGNNGIVTDKFAEEHPYWSAGINMAGDAAALGGIFGGSKILSRTSKPKINILADSSTGSVSLTPALSLQQIEKAFELARLWHLNRINSPGYTNRALKAGFTEEEIPLLQHQLVSLIKRLKLLNPEELFGKNTNVKHNFNGKTNAGYWKGVDNKGNLLLGIEFTNPNMSYDDAVSTFVHEFGHGATFGLNGNETTGYMKLISDLFPLLTRAVKYNKTLYPEVNENVVTQIIPKAGKNSKYYALPTEMLSRGYEFMRDYANNFFKLKNTENLTTKNVLNNAANSRLNSAIFRALTGNLGAFNFLKYALGTSIPVGLGYGLYNNSNLLQQLQYLKQGGKIIQQFKNRRK